MPILFNVYDALIAAAIAALDVVVKTVLGGISIAGFPYLFDHTILVYAHDAIAITYPIISTFNVIPLVLSMSLAISIWFFRKLIAVWHFLAQLFKDTPLAGMLFGG